MGESKVPIKHLIYGRVRFSKKGHKIWLSNDTIEAKDKHRTAKIQLEQTKTRSQKEKWIRILGKKSGELDMRNYINQLAPKM